MIEERQLLIDETEDIPLEEAEWRPNPEQPYQMFSPLSSEEYEALKASIAEYGVSQPVEVDEQGDIIDGHHRFEIARELMIPCPIKVVSGLGSPQAKRDYARQVNCARRSVSTDTKKRLAIDMLREDAERSDSSISKVVGLDNHTIATVREGCVRRGEIPNVLRRKDSLGREQPSEKLKQPGPDLSFIDSSAWKPWHRMEALELLRGLDEEAHPILLEILNEGQREPERSLVMLRTAAGFDSKENERLRELWAGDEQAIVIARLLGTTTQPDPRVGVVMETLQRMQGLEKASRDVDAEEELREAFRLVGVVLQRLKEKEGRW